MGNITMNVQEIIQSSFASARLHFKRRGHLSQMARSPSPIVRIAANAMLAALSNEPDDTIFEDLEYDYRLAGHTQIADAIHDLAGILESVLGKNLKQA
ncbi:MAG: hypothetical protein AAF217_14640 [Pseudomonadota bacterium]